MSEKQGLLTMLARSCLSDPGGAVVIAKSLSPCVLAVTVCPGAPDDDDDDDDEDEEEEEAVEDDGTEGEEGKNGAWGWVWREEKEGERGPEEMLSVLKSMGGEEIEIIMGFMDVGLYEESESMSSSRVIAVEDEGRAERACLDR